VLAPFGGKEPHAHVQSSAAATLFSLNFASTKFREKLRASIKFRDFERKLELECIKLRDFFYSSICS